MKKSLIFSGIRYSVFGIRPICSTKILGDLKW